MRHFGIMAIAALAASSFLLGGCATKMQFENETDTVEWYGYTRHNFTFEGRQAFVVEPKEPAGDGRWSWCAIWPEAFVKRVAIPDLLARGYYHAHIDMLDTAGCHAGMEIMKRFHDYLQGKGLAKQVNFIGMSWGGFFSLRYSQCYPEDVAAIYLDAPVCNAADEGRNYVNKMCQCFKMTVEEFKTSRENPVNNLKVLVDAEIPIMAATGEDDQTVGVKEHINVVEENIKKLGGKIEVIRRPLWGHHPHGFDDTTKLVEFHESVHRK